MCKSLQSDEVCIISAIKGILKTSANIEKFKSTDIEQFPSVKKVLLRVKEETDGNFTYQSTELSRYHQGLKNHKSDYIDKVLACLKGRLKDREKC